MGNVWPQVERVSAMLFDNVGVVARVEELEAFADLPSASQPTPMQPNTVPHLDRFQ